MEGLHSGVQFAPLVHIDLQPTAVAFDDADMTGRIEDVRQMIEVTPTRVVAKSCTHGRVWRP